MKKVDKSNKKCVMEKLIFLVFVLIAVGNTLELISNKVIYENRES